VRLNATLEDTAADYTDTILLNELNDSLMATFSRMVVAARAGYWLKSIDNTVTSPQPKIPLPGRAISGALEGLQIGVGASPFFMTMAEIPNAHSDPWEAPSNQLGRPTKFVMRGDQAVLLPNPDSGVYTIRMWYYLRPSRLVQQQSSTLNSGVIRGNVTAVNTGARTITVGVVPFDQEAVAAGVITPSAITSANQKIDVVHPFGWHELALVGATQTLAGSVFTVGGTADMSEIQVGDYVRAAEQTDWPCIPDEFHRAVADVATVKILAERNMADKAKDFAQSVSADIQRFQDLLLPRVKAESIRIRAPRIGGWFR
jgi:hypothetical protein